MSASAESKGFIELSDERFSAEIEEYEGTALVYFTAAWCGPCKVMSSFFADVASSFPDIKSVKVDVDKNQEAPGKYGVRSIPTFVVFKGGKVVETKVGGMTRASMEEWMRSL